jgi:hypothetical protein
MKVSSHRQPAQKFSVIVESCYILEYLFLVMRLEEYNFIKKGLHQSQYPSTNFSAASVALIECMSKFLLQ